MSTSQELHPSREVLLAFIEGLDTGDDVLELEAHLSDCATCAAALADVNISNGLVEDLRSAFIAVDQGTAHGNETLNDSFTTNSVSELKDFLEPTKFPGSFGRMGHYEIISVAGRGTFGTVFKAFDEILERIVALKVLSPELAASPEACKRFLREARAAAAIRHENVVQIHSVHERPIPYLVMEYIPGETLQQRLDRNGAINPTEVVQMGRQIAAGLAAAHSRGLIHRDIKPGNILLDPGDEERVKITDFGLARWEDDDSFSQVGVIAGTPLYMSPEQVNGAELDHRTDLFSLGTVLYTMLSGCHPFRGPTPLAVIKSVGHDLPRPISEIVPDAPPELCAIINRLHAKKREARIQTAKELVDALGQSTIVKNSAPQSAETISTLPVGNGRSQHKTSLDKTKNERDQKSPTEALIRSRPLSTTISKRTRKVAWKTAIAVGLACLALAVLIVRTNESEFVIDTDSPEIAAMLDANDGIVLEDRKTEQTYHLTRGSNRLPNGEYELTVRTPEGLELDTARFSIKRFGSTVATVRAMPLRPVAASENPPSTSSVNQRAGQPTSTGLAFQDPSFQQWQDHVANLSAADQVDAVVRKLKELNPKFDGQVMSDVHEGVVITLRFSSEHVTDLSPVRALRGLTTLDCPSPVLHGSLSDVSPLSGMTLRLVVLQWTNVADLSPLKGQPIFNLNCGSTPISDLRPLVGMPLTDLNLSDTQVVNLGPLKGLPLRGLAFDRTKVADLSPLRESPLTMLELEHTAVTDLSPLAGMKLKQLNCLGCQVTDLMPLAGQPLEAISCSGTKITSFAPLRGMPIQHLNCDSVQVMDLSPLAGAPLRELSIQDVPIADLTPLKDLPLKVLKLNYESSRDNSTLRGMKSLELINDKPVTEFWKSVEPK